MLPYYVFEDFKEVIEMLNLEGHQFNVDWFYPFFEFRFPKYGHHKIGQLEIELRMALEPWPVLGEEATMGSVSRSVDSSIERLQVKIEGIFGPHLILVCNGRRVPLHRTNKNDTYVAGIRFKAWNPHSCLHPTIPIHSPLIFDIIDTRYERSIGGCTYHVMHPGGRHYDSIPINENEAEGRRLSRFINMGHTPGFIQIPTREINQDFPHTLDLRRFSD